MPFTASHAAAVLPLLRTRLVFSALVAGALAPDIGYFLTFSSRHGESHSLEGLFFICLPAGLLMLLLFHKFLKQPLLALLPVSHQLRLYPYAQDFRFGPASRFVLILVSILIGSVTHLFWDSFTHDNGWVVSQLPELSAPILEIHGALIPVYKLLQHGSTLLGLIVLTVAYIFWFRSARLSSVRPTALTFATKVVIVGVLLVGACTAALTRTIQPLISWGTIRTNVVQGGISFISALALETIVFSLVWHFFRQRSKSVY